MGGFQLCVLKKTCKLLQCHNWSVKKRILAKQDVRYDEMNVILKIEEVEQSIGLLDAVFAYLNLIYPDDKEKL